MRYSLDNKQVNGTTMVVSLLVRLMIFVLGLGIIAGATSFSFKEVFGVGIGLVLVYGSKTIVLTFTD